MEFVVGTTMNNAVTTDNLNRQLSLSARIRQKGFPNYLGGRSVGDTNNRAWLLFLHGSFQRNMVFSNIFWVSPSLKHDKMPLLSLLSARRCNEKRHGLAICRLTCSVSCRCCDNWKRCLTNQEAVAAVAGAQLSACKNSALTILGALCAVLLRLHD